MREKEPADDLITELISADHEGDRLSRQEPLTMLTVLLVAGYCVLIPLAFIL